MQSDGDKLLAFKRLWFKSQPCVVASNIIKYTMETFSSQMYESTLERCEHALSRIFNQKVVILLPLMHQTSSLVVLCIFFFKDFPVFFFLKEQSPIANFQHFP